MKVKMSNMCMIKNGNKVLVQNRTKDDWPGITFPGGKLEADESIYNSCIREVKEETGLDVQKLKLKGIVHYELALKKERWIIYLYETSYYKGTIHAKEGEDDIFWMQHEDLLQANLSNDLDVYLKVYESDDIMEAHAYWDGNTSRSFEFF